MFYKYLARTKSKSVWIVLLALLSLYGLSVRLDLINKSLPYCRHVDEAVWAEIALRMIQTGDFNPRRFKKPTVPTYIMAAGFALGFLQAASNFQVNKIERIGNNAQPFYKIKSVAFTARAIYALLSILTLIFIGFVGFSVFRIPALIFLAPLILSLSSLYLYLSWDYMNVDIVGCFFTFSVLFFLVRTREVPINPFGIAILSGMLCGLTLGSKYNLFPIVLPCLLYFIFYHRNHSLSLCVICVSSMVLTFLVTSPYIVFDFPQFIDHAASEIRHYAARHSDGTWVPKLHAHADRAIQPGIPHVISYLSGIVSSFGWALTLFAGFGLISAFRMNWKKSCVLFSFPIVFLLYMSHQEIHFVRNVVSLHVFFALCAALGLVISYRFFVHTLCTPFPSQKNDPSDSPPISLGSLISHYRSVFPNSWRESVSTPIVSIFDRSNRSQSTPPKRAFTVNVVIFLLFIFFILVSLPLKQLYDSYYQEPESRNQLASWIQKNVSKGSSVLVPKEIYFDDRSLGDSYKIDKVRMGERQKHLDRLIEKNKGAWIVYPHFSEKKHNPIEKIVKPVAQFGEGELPYSIKELKVVSRRFVKNPIIRIGKL